MRESDVVGIKDILECRKNYPVVLCEIRERMEQFHYCSPEGGCFPVIRHFSAAWFVSHVPILPAFLSACTLDALVERKVSRTLHQANDNAKYGVNGTRQTQRSFTSRMRLLELRQRSRADCDPLKEDLPPLPFRFYI